MLKCIIALFLIHGCHHGTGLPVVSNDVNLLQHLANTCENSFLAKKIEEKVPNCKINGSVSSQADLECYMFYDINTQLCEAFQHSSFNLQENYNTKIAEKQNVAQLCVNAKSWKFVTIQPNSAYSVLVKVFDDPVRCQKLCGVGDLLSDDANSYCTYFMWGTEMMQSQALMSPHDDSVLSGGASVLNTGKSVTAVSSNNTVESIVDSSPKADIKPIYTNLTKPVEPKEVSSEKSGQNIPSTLTANHKDDKDKTSEINSGGKINEPSVAPIAVSSVKADMDRPPVEETPPHKDEVESGGPGFEEPKGKLEEINPDDEENDNDDYDQHDELPPVPAGKINKNDNGGGVESDPDVGFKGNSNPSLKIESITFPPQRVPDIYPNGIPDSFTDDDDHFFPIFLTGIVLVVLLYILYHNKSKFTKVVLGLLVEGRQSGRRRNSRGHAYRRLDTLEQAMSSNTAAPPSKIIY